MHSVSHGLHTLDKDDAIRREPIIVQHEMALAHHAPNPNPRPQPPRPSQSQTQTHVAVPGIALSAEGDLLVGDSSTSSPRSWTTLKNVGDGSFGSVWLCDWHSPLPPNTPLSPMQCGPKVRPEWVGRRLVALKRMKRQWEGGWDECRTLKEIESLRSMPLHANIIPLYDCFVLPSTQELYLVFESMEGNLYQLIKSRKGKKALAGGLVTSIFQQVASALDHVHAYGYFHRDMKPENLLVTTTGLANYVSTSPLSPNTREEDVFVIIKLADFGLARETASRPPYTEYVSTRWYRAPEVLLRSRDYSSPVDMWAFGTIMAELLNLLPLFPGSGEMDQLKRINDILGDPSDAYGFDENGRMRGGGPWRRGYDLGKPLGYQFPRNYPTPLAQCFSKSVPRSLIECIEDLLRYDPAERLTAKQCLSHRFLAETMPMQPPPPPLHQRMAPSSHRLPSPRAIEDRGAYTGIPAVSPRSIPPNHAMSPQIDGRPFRTPPPFRTRTLPRHPSIPPRPSTRRRHHLPIRCPLPSDLPITVSDPTRHQIQARLVPIWSLSTTRPAKATCPMSPVPSRPFPLKTRPTGTRLGLISSSSTISSSRPTPGPRMPWTFQILSRVFSMRTIWTWPCRACRSRPRESVVYSGSES
ncbi:Serine/Threonine kinase catalytic domain protein [Rhizoctonia solani AG-3 Rhs1AP]|uniref:Serine/Threonine kinase catalytic domain protein n=1 Tax=Rhizoctonia solani AG-3 Rhs1AP TaxID=1086054 RepID=X8IUA5_9AGAM|nr:Serine/Threonine kinase catalytic domain protein [Rhizoctonia solani AG-3 Rhs1AP]